ncbi:hypothetical protein SRHO_G00141490 [Serrasalmus rhombeus]
MGKCRICGATEAYMKCHLIETHKVGNRKELALLLSLLRSHYKGNLKCELCDRDELTHLDRHLASVHSLQRTDIQQLVKAAKEARLLGQLRELQASRPRPSLVSELDLRSDTDPASPREGEQPTPPESRQPSPAPSHHSHADLTDSDTPVEVPAKGEKPRVTRRQPSPAPSHDTDTELTDSDTPVEATPKKWQKLRVTRRFRKSPVFAAISDFQQFNTTAYASPKDVENSGLPKLQRRSIGRSLRLLHGYLSGYLAIVSGHRPIVFLNLRKSHLDQADVDKQKRALVWVDQHKTDRVYGGACLALNHREVAWLHRLYEVSAQFGGDRCDYMFQYNGRPLANISKELRAAWVNARLAGRVTFRLIRTAIANQAKKHLSTGDRKLICEAMCHGVSTADCFYTTLPGVRDMFRLRELRMNALENDGLEPETVDTDSGEHQTSTSDSD